MLGRARSPANVSSVGLAGCQHGHALPREVAVKSRGWGVALECGSGAVEYVSDPSQTKSGIIE
jgi:hypothetical protein